MPEKELVFIDNNAMLNSKQVAKMLSISSVTLFRLRAAGRLPFVKIGGSYRYRIGDITKILKEGC